MSPRPFDLAAEDFLAPVAPGEMNGKRLAGWVLAFAAAVILAQVMAGDVLSLVAPEVRTAITAQKPLSGHDRLYGEGVFFAAATVFESVCAGLVLWMTRALFGRPVWTFVTPARRWSGLLTLGGVITGALTVGALILAGTDRDSGAAPILDPAYPIGQRAIYALGCAPMVLLLAAAEEAVFRGLVTQFCASLTRSRLVLCALNGAVFAIAHGDPSPAAMVLRMALGAAWTWSVLELAGLEFALGAHFGYDWLILMFGAPPSSDLGRGIDWSFTIENAASAAIVFVMAMGGGWALKRLRSRRS